ncbi:MAG: hypothetical protein PHG97_02495 [Candidatus Margulisbacteria bacterium]|nr:hypothetical protein [Candidatus Margulisiibacteriota bacterium]
MNKTILASLLTLVLVFPVLAQANLGARPMGMGGAFAGLADDVNAIYVNPAGITSVKKESVLVSTRLIEGREYTMIGGVEKTPFGSLGIGYVGSTDPITGSLDLTTWDGESPVRYSSQTLYVSLAQDLNQQIRVPDNLGLLSLGVNVKFSSRKIGTTKGLSTDGGSNIDLDLASVFKPTDYLSFGLAMKNFMNAQPSPAVANLNTSDEKNSTLLAGISGNLFENAVTWSVEGRQVGCEWRPVDGLTLRAGRGNGNTTTGIGFNLNGFSVDYAYLNPTIVGNGAGPVHYWSVSITPKTESKAIAQNEPKKASVLPE